MSKNCGFGVPRSQRTSPRSMRSLVSMWSPVRVAEKALAFVDGLENVRIEGFKDKSRSFGALDCYKIKVKGIPAAVIVPERTRHDEDIVEIIAPKYLRGELKLKNKDMLVIE